MNGNKQYPANSWIGLAKVNSEDIKVLGARNAYVTVVGIAESRKSFRQKIKNGLEKMHLKLQRLEDVELLSDRIKSFEVGKDVLMMAEDLLTNKDQIKYSTFYTYD